MKIKYIYLLFIVLLLIFLSSVAVGAANVLNNAETALSDECDIIDIIIPMSDIEKDINGTIIKISVPSFLDNITFDLRVSEGATWKVFQETDYTNELTSLNIPYNGDTKMVYVCVTAADGVTKKYYPIQVYRKTKTNNPIITISWGKASISTNDVANSDIYYTINGAEPTINSDKYTTPFAVKRGDVIKAVAKNQYKDEFSDIAEKSVPLNATVVIGCMKPLISFDPLAVYYSVDIQSDEAIEGICICSVYDEYDRLIGFNTVHIDPTFPYINDKIICSSMPHTYKVFVWNSFNALAPIANVFMENF